MSRVRKTSPAMPETGCANTAICRPRNSAALSKVIRSSAGSRRNSKPACNNDCSTFPACLETSRNAS